MTNSLLSYINKIKIACFLVLISAGSVIGQTRTSVQTGNWGTASTWDCTCVPAAGSTAVIASGHTVTANNHTIANLTINAGAVLNTANNKDITVTSSLTVNGTLLLEKGGDNLTFSTGPITLAGTGTIDGALAGEAINLNVATTLASGSDLTVINNIPIANGITFTINGNLIVTGDITGGNGSSQVTMGTNSSLEIDGALMATGVLNASTNAGNTVEYNGSVAQSIKNPSSSTYTNLTISGAGTKTFPANAVTLNGNLVVDAGTLNVNSQNITIAGNWENNATISNLATVTFNGASSQSVTTNATNFVNLTINKSSGSLTLNENVVVTGTLTMTTGNVNTGSNSLILGSAAEGTFSYTAGRIIGTFGRFIATGTISQLSYPIGTSNNDRTVAITFDDGGTGGGRSAGVVYASFIASDPGGSGTPVTDDVTIYNTFNEGFWDFTVSGFSKGNSRHFDLALTGNGFSSFTIGSGSRILTRANSGSNWSADGSHNTVSSNTVSRNDITTFPAQFAFGDDTNCTGPSDPTISGVTDVCTSDTNDTYSVTLNSGNDYQWTVVGGTIDGQTNPTGFVTNLNSIDVDWGSTGQAGSVSVVERNSCTTSNTITLVVNINSIAPTSISGSTLVGENTNDVAYSLTGDANTSYNWTVVGGTIDGQTNPTGAVADLTSITVDWGSTGAGSVSVTATKTTPSCSASTQTQLNVTKYIVVDSNLTAGGCNGEWQTAACWATGTVPLSTESARIESGQTMTLQNNKNVTIKNLIINGTLNFDNETVTVGGDLTINSGGTLTGVAGGLVVMSGSLSSPQNQISGTGSFSGAYTINITTASKTIASTAVISQAGTGTNMNIATGLTVTNKGSIQLGGNLVGAAASSTWTNSTNSTLRIGGALLTTGILNASASGNTVNYYSTTAANIKGSASGYQNLEIQGGTKTLTGARDVNGNFTLTSGTLAMGTNGMTVAKNLVRTAGTVTASTGVITLDGTTNQTVSGTWTIPRLTINNTLNGADAITVSNAISVSTALTLTDGIVGSGSNVITVSNCATGGVSGGSSASFVNGILARCTNSTSLYDFPIGESTTYKRAGITPTATGGSTYRVEPFNAAYSDIANINTGTLTNVSSLEYWDIQRTAGTDNAQVRLYWNTQTASGITSATELLVGHYTGGQWESQGNGANSGDVNPGYVESSTAITTFSPFTFASNSGGSNPLPVELTSFTAKKKESHIILQWTTSTEINNDRFEIERSFDGESFTQIGSITGNGNTNQVISYQFTDRLPLMGISFYRLKQVDYDGAFEYSSTITVQIEDEFGLNVIIAPNPTTRNNIQIGVQASGNQPIHISLIDLSGKVLYARFYEVDQISGFIKVHPMEVIKSGLYILKVSQGDSKKILRISIL
jgi:hypothetical protein